MKNYSDLLDINSLIPVTIKLRPIGTPVTSVVINSDKIDYNTLSSPTIITKFYNLMDTISISVELINKHYTNEYETAVIIENISIDNIPIIPTYDYLAEYTNDHDNNNPTSYLGFNGKWTLTIDRPFYQWLHQAQAQGWLLE